MSQHWSFHNPVSLHAGPGLIHHLAEFIPSGRWLLVTTTGFTRRGMTERIRNLLPDVELAVYDQVAPNPELDDLEQAIQQYRQMGLDGILAVGGGSVLDAAKVLAVTIPSELDQPLIQVLRQRQQQQWCHKLPLVVIPTTSGTGAEVTPFATVWDQTEHKKYSIMGDLVYPDKALLDPELTLTLPQKETLFTGLDAISHALESLWNVNRTVISSSFSVQALKLALNALPEVLQSADNLVARTAMQQASVLAGLAISQTRTAIAHSISYPLTIHYGVPHGLACSFTLPRLIEHFLQEYPEEKEKDLFLSVQEMLANLKLDDYLADYVTKEQMQSLKEKMYHPDRVGNFLEKNPISVLDIDRFLCVEKNI